VSWFQSRRLSVSFLSLVRDCSSGRPCSSLVLLRPAAEYSTAETITTDRFFLSISISISISISHRQSIQRLSPPFSGPCPLQLVAAYRTFVLLLTRLVSPPSPFLFLPSPPYLSLKPEIILVFGFRCRFCPCVRIFDTSRKAWSSPRGIYIWMRGARAS
jgi:hypothetical protein